MSEPDSTIHVTSVVCACGCDTLLPSTIVNRGWRYLRGHKPKPEGWQPGLIHARKERAPRAVTKGMISFGDVRNFLDESRKLAQKQLDNQYLIKEELAIAANQCDQRITDLQRQRDSYTAAIGALTTSQGKLRPSE